MQKIYTSNNLVKIQLLKAKLEEENILCYIKNENPPLAGELPSIIAPPELWIMNDDQFAKATEILEQELQSNKLQQAWQCTNCNEKLSAQFNICWKCGKSR